jgi:hypothetical protein
MNSFETSYKRALKAAGTTMKRKFYIRVGWLPKGKSGIGEAYRIMVSARTGMSLPKHEKGVSVFAARWSPVVGKWFVPETHGVAASLGELWYEVANRKSPALLLSGKVVGHGSDGEPLLERKSIITVARLKPSEVLVQGSEDLPDRVVLKYMTDEERTSYHRAGEDVERLKLKRKSMDDAPFKERENINSEVIQRAMYAGHVFSRAYARLMDEVQKNLRDKP